MKSIFYCIGEKRKNIIFQFREIVIYNWRNNSKERRKRKTFDLVVQRTQQEKQYNVLPHYIPTKKSIIFQFLLWFFFERCSCSYCSRYSKKFPDVFLNKKHQFGWVTKTRLVLSVYQFIYLLLFIINFLSLIGLRLKFYLSIINNSHVHLYIFNNNVKIQTTI